MNRVIEIGCGGAWDAGPFFEGADVHYLIESNKSLLSEATEYDPSLTALPEDNAMQIGFPDNSIDIILARNVFGDPLLGIGQNQRNMISGLGIAYEAEGKFSDLRTINTGIKDAIYIRKKLIVQEASRVLITGGSFIIYEQYTPGFARQFFDELYNDFDGRQTVRFLETQLSLVVPLNYAARHAPRRGDVTILGTKL